MSDATGGWPPAGGPIANDESAFASGNAASVDPSPRALRWPGSVAASLALLYLVGVAIGWVTNGTDGYYGILGANRLSAESGRLTITRVAAGGPADLAGLRPGDVVLAVDGNLLGESLSPAWRGRTVPAGAAPGFQTRPLALPPGDVPAFRRLTDFRLPGAHSTIQIQRPGTATDDPGGRLVREVTLTLQSRLSAPGTVLALFTWHVVALLTLAMGIIVLLRRPSDVASRPLLAMATCFAMALLLLSWDNRPFPAVVAVILTAATVFLLIIGSAALMHLCLVFPAPHPLLARLASLGPRPLAPVGGATAALYLIPLAVALGVFLGPAIIWPWSYFLVIALLGLALLALARSILHPADPTARAQLKWIAGPLVVGFSVLALGPGVSAVTGTYNETVTSTAAVAAWGLFPLGVGVAILRYRLLDVDLVLRAAMFYPLLAALLAGVYFVAAQLLGQAAVSLIGPGAADNLTITVLAALLVAAVAHPAYRRLQTGLDRLLYRDRLARQRLLEEANAQIGQTPEDVAEFLTKHVVTRLGLVRAWLVLPGGVVGGDGSAPSSLHRSSELLLARMRGAMQPVLLVEREDLPLGSPSVLCADDPILAAWYGAGARFLLPLRAMPETTNAVGEDLLGLWLAGTRRSGSFLDSEDLRALAQIARQAAVLLDHDRLRRREAEETQRTARFRRYFSPQIADLIAAEKEDLATHRRELTVLFAEVRGFGALSETGEPEELVEQLNSYLVVMTEVIFEQGGTLDKYMGDGVMAFFGDPLPQPDHADRAMRAALAMVHVLGELKHRSSSADTPVDVGIGLATGWVTVGTIGSVARQEYTVVGDAVAVSARLAAAARPGEVLLTEKTRRLLGDDTAISPRGEVTIEGRRQPVAAFGVAAASAAPPEAPEAKPSRSELRDHGESPSVAANARTGAELLARTSLFASLPPEELQALASRLRLHRFKKGEIILRAHEPNSSLFLIRSGTAKVTRALMTGDEAVMNILGRGEFFGELTLIDRQSAGSTVAALQPAEIFVLSRDVFLECLQSYPSAASAAIGLLSERVRRLSDQLEEAYALELPQRLARRLWALGSAHGKKTDEGLVIDLPLTQSDLAGMVGASRQRVNRLLAEWQDRRFLQLGPYGKLTLLRPDTFADFSPEPLDN
ncbi:MAG: cyclic nucleotide-binding domain-containing protein [Chloroflexi bacterium]|nr:cyclic nucleotide-binding domain-containing protein [Chloroflexota bacterium]